MAQAYRYALLGIVGLVTLVALFAIIRVPAQFTVGDDNLVGQASADEISQPSRQPPIIMERCSTRAEQTNTCYGENACCGGECVALPTCRGKPDGRVFTCGDRPMYCCGGELSLISCGVTPVPEPPVPAPTECKADIDCPVINCIRAPCPQYQCINGACQQGPVIEQQCTSDFDCAPNSICIDSRCRGLDECAADAECEAGEVCTYGICIPRDFVVIDDPVPGPVGETQ